MHSLHWFRNDLRLGDNPALTEAANNRSILPVYIIDTHNKKDEELGAASKVWLHHSLQALDQSIQNKLNYFSGDPQTILLELCEQHDIKVVTWNRVYEPWQIKRDTLIKNALTSKGIKVISCNSSLLWEPMQIQKLDGTPYKVFTPFYKKGCLASAPPRLPIPAVNYQNYLKDIKSLNIDDLVLLPSKNWGKTIASSWEIGEAGALKKLEDFLALGLHDYKISRNIPAKPYVSRLSPYLHFGEISPNQIWYAIQEQTPNTNTEHFCSELGWREFSYNLLYFNQDLPRINLQAKFDKFPWQHSNTALKAWQMGNTGIPMVDAGMRELWQTGYMHNRVRMIVGSFLVKNLLIHWHYGASWFWDTLFDADLASNSASWQWIAGCGADAAPYFRIFNPVTQGKNFDPDGVYVRQYIPEIAELPDKYIHEPWNAPEHVLLAANAQAYPKPIVCLKASREQALAAFSALKEINE